MNRQFKSATNGASVVAEKKFKTQMLCVFIFYDDFKTKIAMIRLTYWGV